MPDKEIGQQVDVNFFVKFKKKSVTDTYNLLLL